MKRELSPTKIVIDYAAALHSLYPNAQWIHRGYDYSGLEWMDATVKKPSQKELDDEIARLQLEVDATEYKRKRAQEYPPVADYLDAVVNGDDDQLQEYINACKAVKEKYPKP